MDVLTILPIVPLIGCIWALVNDPVILKGMVSVLIYILYIRERPTNEELVRFLLKIGELEFELLEELESQLRKATTRLANLLNLAQLPLLSTTTLRLPSDNGPFDRIPLEVTTAILDEALQDLGPIVAGELDEARLSIALTCRLWADVFFGNPVWWTVIRAHYESKEDWIRHRGRAAALKSALKRSKGLPLEWTVGPSSGWMSNKELIPVHSSRLKSLIIEKSPSNTSFVSTIVEFPLPQLRCFKMRGGLISDIELDAPNLKELELTNDFDAGTIRFAQATRPAIQTLHIEGSWDDFVRLLSEFSQTVEFLTGVDLRTHWQQVQPASPLFLPSLKALCLRGWCESFPLYVTNVPLLEKITFVNWTLATIDISRHQHTLPSVHIVEWTHRLEFEDLHDLRQILTSVTPSVYTLILERNESDPQATTDSTPNRRLVRVLLNVNMCPKLKELHIRGRSWLTVSSIKRIVDARLGTLRRVTVERVGRGQDTPLAAQAAVKCLRENLEELHIPSEEEWVGASNEVAE
ncbi:hypothetical protein FRB90_012871 [Tulasnella sp. 427]|nr:hypothetical protein FRB90_012871 [Tulasnella sp. 427]